LEKTEKRRKKGKCIQSAQANRRRSKGGSASFFPTLREKKKRGVLKVKEGILLARFKDFLSRKEIKGGGAPFSSGRTSEKRGLLFLSQPDVPSV